MTILFFILIAAAFYASIRYEAKTPTTLAKCEGCGKLTSKRNLRNGRCHACNHQLVNYVAGTR